MGELIVWLIVGVLVFAVLRLIWPFIVLGIAVYLAIKLGKHVVARRDKAVAARRAVQRELRARADRQHAQILRGDPAGVYGQFPVADLGEYNPTLWVCNRPITNRRWRRSSYQRTSWNGYVSAPPGPPPQLDS